MSELKTSNLTTPKLTGVLKAVNFSYINVKEVCVPLSRFLETQYMYCLS